MMATPPSLPEITGMAVKLWDTHSTLEKIAKHLGTLWLMARQEAGRRACCRFFGHQVKLT